MSPAQGSLRSETFDLADDEDYAAKPTGALSKLEQAKRDAAALLAEEPGLFWTGWVKALVTKGYRKGDREKGDQGPAVP